MKKHMTAPFAVKSMGEDGVFEGYGSVFGNLDHSRDVVLPGAFAKSLAGWRAKGSMPPVLWQHDSRCPVGVYIDIKEDDHGLYVKGQLLKDDVQQAKEAYALMLAGAVTGLSIGYMVADGGAEYDREANITTLKELELWEVSPVTFPDNDLARVRAVKEIATRREFEKFLRESGFSKAQAIRIAGQGFERRESAADDAELVGLIEQNIKLFGGKNAS